MGLLLAITGGVVMLILGLIASGGPKKKPECTCPRHGVAGR